MLREMLTVSSWVSYCGGRWKCSEVVLHAGGSHRLWMGSHTAMNLGASSGQMRDILGITAEDAEVSINIFGAINIGMLMLLVFLIWGEHLMAMLAVFLAYRAVIHVGGFARG